MYIVRVGIEIRKLCKMYQNNTKHFLFNIILTARHTFLGVKGEIKYIKLFRARGAITFPPHGPVCP